MKKILNKIYELDTSYPFQFCVMLKFRIRYTIVLIFVYANAIIFIQKKKYVSDYLRSVATLSLKTFNCK